jgi:hypothetical protein
MESNMNDTQREIKRWLDRLDEMALAVEARWGIGNLPRLCSETTAQKYDKQNEKLAVAIREQDIRQVQDLVNGFGRAYEVMEREALERGNKPSVAEYMEVALESGFKLRIARNNTEARSVTEKNVYVWTLEEVARVIEKDYTLVNVIKAQFDGAEVKSVRKFKPDSDMPF